MGKYDQGILGAISGKVGTVIGSNWKGIDYLRSLGRRRKNSASEAQLQQQAKFKLAVDFLQPLHPIIKIGYRTQVRNQSTHNAALSELLSSVIEGDYPNYLINFNRLRISKGSMEPPKMAQARFENDQVVFSWDNNSDSGDASADDAALLLAYCENKWPVYDLKSFSRSDAEGQLSLPNTESGQVVYCFMAFAGINKKKSVSNSSLVATLTIP